MKRLIWTIALALVAVGASVTPPLSAAATHPCYEHDCHAVDRDVTAASKLGAVVTPTLLINNLKALGYTDLDSLSMFVRAALESGSVSQ